MKESKSQLREKYRQKRRNIPNRQLLDTLIVENCFKTLTLKNYKSVGLYIPIDGEVNPLAFLDKLDKTIISLPYFSEKKEMSFRSWKKGDPLIQSSKLKISYPATGEAVIPELIFVPLVAFNASCYRLGFGKGFFDRFILNSRLNKHNTLYVGLGYDEQCCTNLIVEEHDQALDLIITQKMVFKRG